MPSRVITATVTSGSNVDKKGGTYVTFGSITSDTGPVWDCEPTSATLYLSKYKTYAASFYLDVIYGGNSGIVVASTETLDSNSTNHSSTESIDYLTEDSLTESVSTITLGVVSTSGTGNKINIRDGCTLTMTINYENKYGPCTAPTSVSLASTTVDAGASTTLSWSGATAGKNNPIRGYVIYRSTSASNGYTELTTTTNTSYSVTAPSTMGSKYYYKVATLDTIDGSQYLSTVYATLTARTYTACTAPTAVSVNSTGVAPSASVTLSWSGAAAGTNNAITGYQIYRATSATGTYNLLTSVSVTATSGSTSVTAPSASGSSYYYKVLTVGTKSGYNSGQSSKYATLTCTFTAPSAPSTVTIGGSTSAYALSGANVTLAWSGAAAGTNNAITGYAIYRDGAVYVEKVAATTTSYSVPAHSTAGSSYAYTVVTLGTHSNSTASAARTVYTYSHPTAPARISVSTTQPDAGAEVRLSWSEAVAGHYNAISSYNVYRSSSSTDNYSLLTTITSTETSGACMVTAPNTMGSAYYYRLETVGERSGSGQSSAYAKVTAKTYTACSTPTNVTLSSAFVMPDASATLSWTASSSGTNNALTGYAIYRKEGNGSYALFQSVNASITSLTVSAPTTPGSGYTYYVVALGTKAGYDSAASSTVTLSSYAYTACSVPTTISLSAELAEDSAVLSWNGAAAGISNPITGYRISAQNSTNGTTWGEATLLQTLSTSDTSGSVSVAPPAIRGAYRRFIIQTLGTASGFDSSEAVCPTLLRKNRAPAAPTFLSGTETYVHNPLIRLQYGDEPDGQSQTLMLSVDDGTAEPVAAESRLQDLSFGDHIIRAYSLDSMGAASSVTAHTLTVINSGFTDSVLTAGQTFVKAVHINELRARINTLRAYYGLSAYGWSAAPVAGETGLVSWRDHVLELRSALAEAYASVGITVPAWTDLPVNCPKAIAIDELREAVQAI